MVEQHAELERRLTERLLTSRPDNRTAVWVESYDTLYHDLPWLAGTSSASVGNADLEFGHFLKLIPAGSSVIEIGSGAGSLSRYLSDHGRPCVATDITEERGGTRQDGSVQWHATDGVHLEDYEAGRLYDAVLSTQVIEHLHPDDVERHFRGAVELLRPRGFYVFNTPHVFMGPADLSRVFAYDRARFMHLKEYTHAELGALARRAGFRRVHAVYVPPAPIRAKFPFLLRGGWLYRYLTAMERLIGGRRVPRPILRALLFHTDVFLVATK
ncbi:class I SAM-dependent methyltransferase [Mycobacterium sp. SA01]|uniref:class I SAM-dependent methyltransferase n=1 Tax=Mycobacterium sp. SA01 TaxID=3238820 RepID=UPI00351BE735